MDERPLTEAAAAGHRLRPASAPTLLTAGALLLAVPAAAAAAPTVGVDRPCYSAGQPIRVAGQGFSPNGALSVHLDFFGQVNTHADLSGGANQQGVYTDLVAAPQVTSPADLREQVTLTATDPQLGPAGAPESTAQTNFLLSRALISIPAWKGTFRPSGKSRVEARGFVGGSTSKLYAHYLQKKKLRKTVEVGKLTGPCGDLSKRMRNVPFAAPAGTYSVRFDTARHYPNRSIGATLKFRIRRQRL
jgi:hypothetical protein